MLGDWQLEKMDRIFKREKFEIHSTELNLTQQMNQSWEQVGGADSTMGDFMAPYDEFLSNIEKYKFNRLLDIGITIVIEAINLEELNYSYSFKTIFLL